MLIHVGDTLPVLTGQIRLDGQPFDLTAGTTTVELRLVGPDGTEVVGSAAKTVANAGRVTYVWQSGDTDEPGVYYGSWVVTTASGTFTQPGVDVVVYDPDVLWANTAAVEAICGQQETVEPVVAALVQAQQAILSWVVREIPTDPVPDQVRRAHAILAARVVSAPSFTPGSSSGVIQESVGDHSVRYSRPQEVATVLDPSMHSDVVKLLKPWAPTNYTSGVSDEAGGELVSRSTSERLPASSVDYTSTQTVADVLDGLSGNVTPSPHASSHGSSGSDPISLDGSQITSGTVNNARLPAITALYGTGVNGNATITSTVTLASDVFYDNLTVNGTLVTNGFRVFVANTLSGSGAIRNDGVAAGNSATGGAGGAAGVFAAGGGGGNSSATTGTQAGQVTNRVGGEGGAGGGGSPHSGGGGQSGTVPVATSGGSTVAYDHVAVRSGRLVGSSTSRIAGGVGGSGGGGDGTNSGGGGGGGGGCVYVAARLVAFTGVISAAGGAGGGRVTGNVGGGGGGGGGLVSVVTASSSATFTTSVVGGVGGAAAGTGVAGQAGQAGVAIVNLGVK